jgi:hypothetical protein
MRSMKVGKRKSAGMMICPALDRPRKILIPVRVAPPALKIKYKTVKKQIKNSSGIDPYAARNFDVSSI